MQTQQSEQLHILQNQVVVFSKNYLPLARINLKRAIVLLVTGQAETLDFSSTQQWEVRSPSVVLQISEHIRLTSGKTGGDINANPYFVHSTLHSKDTAHTRACMIRATMPRQLFEFAIG